MHNSKQIAERCKREIKHSKNRDQLATALRYGILAKKQGHLTDQDCYDIRYLGFWQNVYIEKGLFA
jgi:hypothetical protein